MNTTSTGTRWKDNLRKGLLARIFCVLPSIRAINATTNAEETVLTRRRILPEDEASEQNHGYLHSRLITLSLLPRSLLLTSHLSALTCHLRRATSSPQSYFFGIYREFSSNGLFCCHSDPVSLDTPLVYVEKKKVRSVFVSCRLVVLTTPTFEVTNTFKAANS